MNGIPQLLQERFSEILGENFASVLDAFSHERVGSFRVNTLRSNAAEVLAEGSEKGIGMTAFSGIDGAYIFDRSHEYTLKGTRAFYDGKIYLQSIASMLPVLALAPRSHDRILDVCAAPGSKTTQAAMLQDNTGEIVAIEQNQIRYDKLMYNCRLQGADSVRGIKQDALKYLSTHTDPYFDRIILDVPCSAEGRIHIENEKTYGFWSLSNILKKASLQYDLLTHAFGVLKVGGSLIYSTCTLAPEENEGVIAKFLHEYPDAILEPIDIGLSNRTWWQNGLSEFSGVSYAGVGELSIRILPSHETEGFFMAKIRKIEV